MSRPSSPGAARPTSPEVVRLIGTALTGGMLVFAGVILVIHQSEGLDLPMVDGDLDVLQWIAVGVAAPAAVVAWLARGSRYLVAARSPSEDEAARAFAQGSILFLALLEGAGMFNLVVWMLLGSLLPNGLVAFLLWLAMLTNLPTRARFEALRETRPLDPG